VRFEVVEIHSVWHCEVTVLCRGGNVAEMVHAKTKSWWDVNSQSSEVIEISVYLTEVVRHCGVAELCGKGTAIVGLSRWYK
jgi:hypothetical protein